MSEESEAQFDYLVLGGGTAGCIVAARLSEQPGVSVLLVEAGPSDADEPRAASIRRWDEMLEGEYDLDYRSEPQARGNSFIRQARLRILGGCSTANTMISWRPLRGDLDEWASLGLEGWGYEEVSPWFDRIAATITPVAAQDQNPYIRDAVDAAAAALEVPRRERWNDVEFIDGAGFFEIGYEPSTNQRSSASFSYLHSQPERPGLTIRLESIVERLLIEDDRAVGAVLRNPDGTFTTVRARHEVVVSCGAIDTPALLMRSGIGPAGVLEAAGVPVLVDAPGVGENLQDHAEGLVVWEAAGERSAVCATGWDAGYVVSVDPSTSTPDISTHIPLHSWTVHAERVGARIPTNNVSLAPNVAKPRSRGRVWITSPEPDARPSIDYGSFTDPEGRDERMLVEGVRLARRVAAAEPLATHLVREVFPGPEVQSDEALSAVLRETHQTVYHVSCTARMGADGDQMAVLDSRLRVRGVEGLRVVDASVFPTITALNPVGMIMTIAERAAAFLLEDRAQESAAPSAIASASDDAATFRALLLDEDLRLTVGHRPAVAPAPGEVVVAVERAGICGSDLHVLRSGDWVSYWPATLGHEVVGRILQSSDPGWPVGTRVLIDSRTPRTDDGRTVPADRLDPNLTWLGEERPGGFAERVVVSTATLHAVPDALDAQTAVLAEPLAVTLCAFDQARVERPETVLIIGHGPIGFLANAEVRRRWPEAAVDVIDPVPERSDLARELGAHAIAHIERDDYDLVIDAAGYDGSLAAAVAAAARGGSILLVALGHSPSQLIPADVVERSLTITGSVGFDTRHLDEALRILEQSPDVYRRSVTHTIPLLELPAFLASPARREAMKILVDCGGA